MRCYKIETFMGFDPDEFESIELATKNKNPNQVGWFRVVEVVDGKATSIVAWPERSGRKSILISGHLPYEKLK